MLIGGGPGSGKTILTLSLLHKLKSLGLEVTFISTRLPIDTLFKTTPLCQDLGIESLVDSSLQRGHKDGPKVARVPITDLSDLAMLLLHKCSEKSVVALDSWNALLQREKRSEEEVYRAAMDLINRTPGGLIFTTEDSTTLNPLQHVVDSHVRLEVGMVDGSRIRFLHVDKLRGQQIDTPSYVFTLADGCFNALDPRDWCLRERPIRAPKLPEPLRENGIYFSTGLKRLDKILGGGYKHGSHIGIEVDLEAPAEVFDLTFLPTAADFLMKQRPVIILPPGARDANSLWDTIRNIIDDKVWSHLKTELIDKYVRVLSFGSRTKDNSTVSVGSDIMNDLNIWRKTKKELKYRFGQPILGIIGYTLCPECMGPAVWNQSSGPPCQRPVSSEIS